MRNLNNWYLIDVTRWNSLGKITMIAMAQHITVVISHLFGFKLNPHSITSVIFVPLEVFQLMFEVY